MITAVWMSPDRTKLYVQFLGEENIAVLDARYEQLRDADVVPTDAEPLFDPEAEGDYEGIDLEESVPEYEHDAGYGA